MAFTSQVYPGERVFGDSASYEDVVPKEFWDRGRGLVLEMKGEDGYGDSAKPFPADLLIDPSEYESRIQEIEERKSRLSDHALMSNLPCKDQQSTNYCWINAPVHTIEVSRMAQNQEPIILSPASAGAPIKGFRNIGGWGLEGIVYLEKFGCVPVAQWPANAIDRRYYTEENKKLALLFRPTEWWEIRTQHEMNSYLLRRMGAVACGYNWWRHETTRYDMLWLDGAPAYRERNSYGMNYGYKGFFILQGSKAKFDDAVTPRVVIAS